MRGLKIATKLQRMKLLDLDDVSSVSANLDLVPELEIDRPAGRSVREITALRIEITAPYRHLGEGDCRSHSGHESPPKPRRPPAAHRHP